MSDSCCLGEHDYCVIEDRSVVCICAVIFGFGGGWWIIGCQSSAVMSALEVSEGRSKYGSYHIGR
jgi:hypothetical protein